MSRVEDRQHDRRYHYESVEVTTETGGESPTTDTKKLGVLGLVMITYFCVSGGPYGIEVS